MIRKLFGMAFNLGFGILLLAFLPSVTRQLMYFFSELIHGSAWIPFGFGAVLGLAMERLLDRYIPEVATFEHELTHAIVGIPFGFIPVGISVSGRVGNCRQVVMMNSSCMPVYPVAKRIVALAPYFLPTFTVIMAGFRPIVPAGWQPWYDTGIGVTFGYHALSTIVELRDNFTNGIYAMHDSGELTQSDIGKSGMIFSPIFILVMTIAVHGLILAVLTHGYAGAAMWGGGTWTGAQVVPFLRGEGAY